MTKGAILIAYNTPEIDYYKMACHTAKRINQFLDLPVSIITSSDSITDTNYLFDKTIINEADQSNYRKKSIWINKNRYKVYDLSPYDETLLLDTDYLINSNKLLSTFNSETEFLCHRNVSWIFDSLPQEQLHSTTVQTCWATVIKFNKTKKCKQIFDMIEMIQNNYDHYSMIYKFESYVYRNDYALTIALKTVNGHIENLNDYIPWNLCHVANNVKVIRESDTRYIFLKSENKKTTYIKVSDMDFHMLDKKNFMELFE